MEKNAKLYLDLLKKCLTCYIYDEEALMRFKPIRIGSRAPLHKRIRSRFVSWLLGLKQLQLVQTVPYDPKNVQVGLGWPEVAHTMIGMKRLDNVQKCCEEVIKNNVPGDFIETGVWRGGATILMRAALKAYGVTDRTVWVADSFAGLPPPNAEKYPADKGDTHFTYDFLQVPLEKVQANFQKYDLLDSQVKFLKGWFSETLPKAPIQKLAILRLDGDMYESTMDGLNNLYSKLSVGGFLIVDDYGLEGCKRAIHDFRQTHNISDEIVDIDGQGVYWQRTKSGGGISAGLNSSERASQGEAFKI